MSASNFIPYCGHPPVPGHVTWNTDPVLIGVLLGIGLIYAIGCRNARAPSRRERFYFVVGLATVSAALISPLCNLSVALFAARVTQHMILTLIAAPLIVLGRPDRALAGMMPLGKPWGLFQRYAMAIGGAAFAIAMWTWHMPGPYDATLENNYVFWTMHITTFGAAMLLWYALLRQSRCYVGAALAVTVGTGMQMGLLGAVLTFAPTTMFAVHFATTWPWGLSQLQDQQLGGIIMWVPAGLLFTAYGLAAFGSWLNAAPSAGAIENRQLFEVN